MPGKIGKYTVEKELGQGGFGKVYLAFDPDVGQPVAIKKLLAQGDPDLLKRFQLEIRTTASLRHKNIVTIHASGEESGDPYLVMEFLEGSTLKQLIHERRPLSLLDRVRIMTQVAEGLGYAHSKGVVHRDVKPENIMLLSDDTVKIMDFGIALGPNRNTAVTQTGGIIGTPPYFAPEQLEGFKANEQTDIFSFGDVYYELLTGVHPFEQYKSDWKSLQIAIISHEPRSLSELVPGCPEALETLVHRTLAKDPEFRYQRFAEIQLDSEAILVDLKHEGASAILRQVDSLVESGNFQTALSKINEAFQLDPGNRDVRRRRDEINQRLQKGQVETRVNRMLADAEAQLTERRYPEAVQTLESIVKLDSTHRVASVRLREAKALLEGYLRANRLVAEGRFQQQKGLLADAYDCYQKALEIDPDHTDARRLGHHVSEQLARRRADRQREEAISAAREHAAARRFDQALEVVDQALKELPDDNALAEVREEILQAKAEESRRQRAERLNLGVARTRETLQAGDLDRARQMLDLLDASFASEPGATVLLRDLREQWNTLARAREISQYKEKARGLLKEDSFQEVLDLLAEALAKYPGDAGLEQMRQMVKDSYQAHQRSEAIAAVLHDATSKRDAGDLQGALQSVSKGRREFGDEARLVDLARQLELEIEQRRYTAELESLLRDCRASMAAGRHAETLARLERAGEFSGEAEVIVLREQARTAAVRDEERRFVEDVLSAAAKLQAEGASSQAFARVEEGLARYPEDPNLKSAALRLQEQVALERLRGSIEMRRSGIRREIQEGAWSRAEAALGRAREEFPGDPAFDDLADEVKRGVYEAGWRAVESGVQRVLAAGDPAEAKRKLADAVTATRYASDPRWQALALDVDRRIAYEETLVMAERQQGAERFSEAEELLTEVINRGAPDQRAHEMRGTIQRRRSEAARQREIGRIAEEVREYLGRNQAELAESRLFAARTRYPGEAVWDELEARLNSLRRTAGIAGAEEEIRQALASGDIRKATDRLAAARLKYPGEAAWAACQQEIARRNEVAAARERVGQWLARKPSAGSGEALLRQRRENLRSAASELDAARAQYRGEPAWSSLQSEIDARLAFLNAESEIAARLSQLLERGEVGEARSRLVAARVQCPDDDLWHLLLAEVDRCEERLKAGAEIARVADAIRECLRKDDLRAASEQLAAARARYPGEELWERLRAEILARQETLQREAEIAKIAAGIRAVLEQGVRAARVAEAGAPPGAFPIAPVWGVLQDASARLQQARTRYPGSEPWNTLAGEIAQRQSQLQREISDTVRACPGLEPLDWHAKQLAVARNRYPGEPFWAVLQALIDAVRAPLQQASLAEFESLVRKALQRNDLPAATLHVNAARTRHPDARIWGELQAEIDARIQRQNVLESAERGVREQVAQVGRSGTEPDWLGIQRFQKAGMVLAEARAKYPREERLAALQGEIAARRGEWKRALATGIANLLQQHPGRPALESLQTHIRSLREAEREEPLWQQFEEEAGRQAALLERQAEVASCGERVRQCLRRADVRQGAAELDAARKRFPNEPLWTELETDLRGVRDGARDRLLTLERQIASESHKRKRKEFVQQAVALAGGYPEDAEIAGIAARVRALADAPAAAPPTEIRLPWKPIAGVAAALVAAAGLYLWLHNRKPDTGHTTVHTETAASHEGGTAPSTVPFEIRTDPPGAEVKLGDRSCKTPDCRFDLAPGSYSLDASLEGYEALHQPVTVTSSSPLLDLTLKPLPAPPKTAQTGTLIVQTGMADVLISVDRVASARTDQSGSKTLTLDTGSHEVDASRSGYEKIAPRKVSVAAGSRQTLALRLRPLPARLELSGAPDGVEIRIGGASLGRTDGTTPFLFPTPVTPGDQDLEVSWKQGKGRLAQQHFAPGQPTRLNWKDVSSVLPAPPPPPPNVGTTPPVIHLPTAEELEEKDWGQVSATPDIAKLREFLRSHPKGKHAADAQNRIWDLEWAAVNQANIDAVRAFLHDHSDNVRHGAEARKLVDSFEALKRAEDQKKNELQRQTRDALTAVNSVMQPRKTSELKKLWPGVSRDMISAIGMPRIRMAFDATTLKFTSVQDNQIDATCDLVTNNSNVRPATVTTAELESGVPKQEWRLDDCVRPREPLEAVP